MYLSFQSIIVLEFCPTMVIYLLRPLFNNILFIGKTISFNIHFSLWRHISWYFYFWTTLKTSYLEKMEKQLKGKYSINLMQKRTKIEALNVPVKMYCMAFFPDPSTINPSPTTTQFHYIFICLFCCIQFTSILFIFKYFHNWFSYNFVFLLFLYQNQAISMMTFSRVMLIYSI